MPNQYTPLTAKNVLVKMHRRRNPVKSISQLAREFGMVRSPTFRNRVRTLVGNEVYNTLRDSRFVNAAYK